MLLGWYDPDKKKSVSDKLSDAVERHITRNGQRPRVAYVNPQDAEQITTAPLGIELRPARHVALNTFFVGFDEEDGSR